MLDITTTKEVVKKLEAYPGMTPKGYTLAFATVYFLTTRHFPTNDEFITTFAALIQAGDVRMSEAGEMTLAR